MARKCIVCDEPAGSGEHVFPASMGGRRINKNIYCSEHDNSYSNLVEELVRQFDFLNAMLGVVRDHSKEAKSTRAREMHSGEEVMLSAKDSTFIAPRVISQKKVGNGMLTEMSLPNRKSLSRWIEKVEQSGHSVEMLSKPQEDVYILGKVHQQRKFGGEFGLGAVAYIGQNILAVAFPELTRSGDVAKFIAYTQAIAAIAQLSGDGENPKDGSDGTKLAQARKDLQSALLPWGGQAPVWWDFEPQPDLPMSDFAFGHRITVGVDATDGLIYGRFSLFSSIHFGMAFGRARSCTETKAVVMDIDPLAPHPPNDIKVTELPSAIARVSMPATPAAGLWAGMSSGTQAKVLSDLIRRIQAHALSRCAAKMYAELDGYRSMSEEEGRRLIDKVISGEAQRVWNLATAVLDEFKATLPAEMRFVLGPMIDEMTAHDSNSPNGLTPQASETLELAKEALARQIQDDIRSGNLTVRRVEELIGEGPGAHVVGQAILATLAKQFPN